MALLMQPGQAPETEEERADFDAIEAIREESVSELKEQGNELMRKGSKQGYTEALDSYTKAIALKASNATSNSVLYSNRAQANLLLGNYRRAMNDSEDAIKLNVANVKAYFRGAKAGIALTLWSEALRFCAEGLKRDPQNQELDKLRIQIQQKLADEVERQRRASERNKKLQALVSAISKRKLRIGRSLWTQHTGSRQPTLDNSGILHWPVLLLYGETMVSDMIEDFAETDMFRHHLDTMFGEDAPPLPWDKRKEYSRKRIELYYQANLGPVLSTKEVLKALSQGDAGYEIPETEEDTSGSTSPRHPEEFKDPTWVKVNENATLHDVVTESGHIIAGTPVFYVVASRTKFRDQFLSGNWSAP